MINITDIQTFYPSAVNQDPQHKAYMLKEYFHYKMPDIIFNSRYANKLTLIGGTGIRILHADGQHGLIPLTRKTRMRHSAT